MEKVKRISIWRWYELFSFVPFQSASLKLANDKHFSISFWPFVDQKFDSISGSFYWDR